MSFGPDPSAASTRLPPSGSLAHAPFSRWNATPAPNAQTSVAPLPQIASMRNAPVVSGVYAVPFQWNTRPSAEPTHTSSRPLLQIALTATGSVGWIRIACVHAVPS